MTKKTIIEKTVKTLQSLPDDFDENKERQEHVEKKVRPKAGSMKGMFVMKPDFDEPLDDFKEYME